MARRMGKKWAIGKGDMMEERLEKEREKPRVKNLDK
jgi:hypothetical protein